MPYKSRAQAAYFNIHRAELERQGVNVDEWNSASKGMKLPKHAQAGGAQMGPMGPMGPPGAGDPIGSLLQRYMMDELMRQMQSRSREGIIPPELLYMQRGINPSRGMGDPMEMGGTNQLPGWQKAFGAYHPKVPSEFEPEPFIGEADLPMRPHSREFGPPTNEFPGLFEGEPFNPPQRQEGGPVEDTSVGDPNLMWRDPIPALSGMVKGIYHGVTDPMKEAIESAGRYAQTGEYEPKLGWDLMQQTIGGSSPFIGSKALTGAAGTFGGKMISGVEEAIKDAPFKKAPASQWMGYLTNKPGVKKEEMEYMGVPELLGKGDNPIFNKEQMADYAKGKRLELKDVVLGGNPYEDLIKQMKAKYGPDLSQVTPEESEALRKAFTEARSGNLPTTRHGAYQLPGGENYEEHLMQKVAPEMQEAQRAKALDDFARERYGHGLDHFNQSDRDYITRQWASSGYTKGSPDDTFYHQSHWGQTPNVMAHVRHNDRMINGKKTLFIEEMQSDWHQQGRQKGYFDKKAYEAARDNYGKLENEQREAHNALYEKIKRIRDEKFDKWDAENALYAMQEKIDPAERQEALKALPDRLHKDALAYGDLYQRYKEAQTAYSKTGEAKGIPEAPLKTTWPEMALQRILKKAADKGYEQVAWTSGGEQATRYWGEPEKRVVNKLRYDPDWRGPGGRGLLSGYNEKSGDLTFQKEATPEEIARLVGKETADELIARSKNPSREDQYITGLNKDFQAHGMQGFYDKMLPIFANKIGKPYGAKVEPGAIHLAKKEDQIARELTQAHGPGLFPSPTRGAEIHIFHLPEKMREDLKSGAMKLPMFRARGGRIVIERARGGHIPNLVNSGLLKSDVPGRTDNLNIHVPSGAYVIPADVVAGEGQGNTDAGAKKFHAMFSSGPLGMKTLKGRGSGPKVGHLSRIGTTRLPRGSSTSAVKQTFQTGGAPEEDTEGQPTPILAAGGEFIVHPHVARRIGRGDLKQGHRILDAFVLHARKQHVKQIKNLKPPVKP